MAIEASMTLRVTFSAWAATALLLAGSVAPQGIVHAQSEPLEELVVSGEQPGPSLWEVRRGDHRVWILATLVPLPRKLQWRSRELESVIARSQLVIAPVDVDADIGFFTALRLVRPALRARALPDDQRLADVLEPATYARWQRLKSRYLPKDDKVERWRPMFAGGALFEAALESAKLNPRGGIWRQVKKLAKDAKVPLREAKIEITLDDPRGLIADFARTPLSADIACFESLLEVVDTQLPMLRERANAWATGDVATLRRLPLEDSFNSCLDAANASPRVAKEIADARRRVEQERLLVIEGALLRNTGSLAVLELRELIGADGLLARLRAAGYDVIEPDAPRGGPDAAR
jgi:uncharacterized protein YbaP (TraB family)